MIIHQLQVSFVDVFLGFCCTSYASLSSARAAHAPQSLLDSWCQFQCRLEIKWSLNGDMKTKKGRLDWKNVTFEIKSVPWK